VSAPDKVVATKTQLSILCDEVICLESKFKKNGRTKSMHTGIGALFSLYSSLRMSNYVIGEVEFTKQRIEQALAGRRYDAVLYEYWHAHKSASFFQEAGVPCVLDMHNVLWRSYETHQKRLNYLPSGWLTQRLQKYTAAEENAWRGFDGIIAINREEEKYVKARVGDDSTVFFAPMGIDLAKFPYLWRPNQVNPRIAYYGGLAGPHNRQGALDCYTDIMPVIWRKFPDAELWIIGSDPSKNLIDLSLEDRRVKVTGFVEDLGWVMSNITMVVCPWTGRYGFRSRLIEVMALGVPLVSTPDAVYGMEFEEGRDLLLGSTNGELAENALLLIENPQMAQEQSQTARQKVEALYSVIGTYDRLASELDFWLNAKQLSGINRAIVNQ